MVVQILGERAIGQLANQGNRKRGRRRGNEPALVRGDGGNKRYRAQYA